MLNVYPTVPSTDMSMMKVIVIGAMNLVGAVMVPLTSSAMNVTINGTFTEVNAMMFVLQLHTFQTT